MQITIKPLNDSRVITLDVKPLDIVRDIKFKIELKEEDMFAVRQKLIFNGAELNENRSLASCKVEDKSTIFLIFKNSNEIKIEVQDLTGESLMKIKRDSSSSILSIKNLFSFPIEEIVLIYNGILEDERTLDFYNIKNNSILILVRHENQKIQIIIKKANVNDIKLDCNGINSIKTIKKMIQKKEGYALYQIRLVFDGKLLENEKTLDFYKIENRSILNLTFRY